MLGYLLALTCVANGADGLRVPAPPDGLHLGQNRLVSPAEIESAPVESLAPLQLVAEERRLLSPPSLALWIVMLSGGAVAAGVGALGTYVMVLEFNAKRNTYSAPFILLGAVFAAAMGIAGLTLGTLGGIILGVQSARRTAYRQRLSAVRARLDALGDAPPSVGVPVPPTGGSPTDPAALPPGDPAIRTQRELFGLEAQRPGLLLPIALLAVGVTAGAGLVVTCLPSSGRPCIFTSGGSDSTVIGVGAVALIVTLAALGTWQLVVRLGERRDIDAKIEALRHGAAAPPSADPAEALPPPPPPPVLPPGAENLPPLPIYVGYAARF